MAEQKDDEGTKKRRSSDLGGGKSRLGVGKSTQFFNRSMSRLKVRRASYGFSSVPGIAPVRSSQVGFEFRRPIQVYLPTYQLDAKHPFHLPTVLKLINGELDEQFAGHKYNVQQSPALALKVAADLMKATKDSFDRYRIICVVCVGQRRAQSYNNAVTMLWDHERDKYANVQREHTSCFVQVTLFGIYLD